MKEIKRNSIKKDNNRNKEKNLKEMQNKLKNDLLLNKILKTI